jgi:hypothetical protein
MSVVAPLTCVVLARRRGGLSTTIFASAAATLLLVDVLQLRLMQTADAGAPANWTWGAIGVTVLVFAAYRPARDVLMLGAGHTLLGVIAIAGPVALGEISRVQGLVVVSACVIPALVATQYMALYVRAVRLRDAAVLARRDLETRTAAEEAIRQDALWRLGALRAQIVPLFARVADGSADTNDPAVALEAQRLAESLRRELVDARAGRWLLDVPRPRTSDDAHDSDGGWSDVVLLDPLQLAYRLRGSDRAALVAFLNLLRRHGAWHRVTVSVLPPTTSGGASDAFVTLEAKPELASVTLVAIGDAALTSWRDPEIRSAAARLEATVTVEPDNILIADATVGLELPDPLVTGALQ